MIRIARGQSRLREMRMRRVIDTAGPSLEDMKFVSDDRPAGRAEAAAAARFHLRHRHDPGHLHASAKGIGSRDEIEFREPGRSGQRHRQGAGQVVLEYQWRRMSDKVRASPTCPVCCKSPGAVCGR